MYHSKEHASHNSSVPAASLVLATGEKRMVFIGLLSMSGPVERKRTQQGFSAAVGLPMW